MDVYLYERSFSMPFNPVPVTVNGDVTGKLPEAWGVEVRDVVVGRGSGGVSCQLTDPVLPELLFGRLLMFDIDGAATLPIVIEKQTRRRVEPGEEAEQSVAVSGSDAMVVLSEAVVYPERPITGEDAEPQRQKARIWNCSSLLYDPTVSPWFRPVATPQDGNFGEPGPWPFQPHGQWIGPEDSSTPDLPPQTFWLVTDYSPEEQVSLGFHVAADDLHDTYIENELKLQEDHFYAGQSKDVIVPTFPSYHRLAVRVTNVNTARQGLKLACYILGDEKQPVTLFFDSNEDDWWCWAEDHDPGFTPGAVLIHLLEEAQARGAIPDVKWSFSATHDSGGNLWPETAEITTEIGRTLLEIVTQLSETYIDAFMDSTLTLDAFNKGTRGAGSSGATWQPLDNLLLFEAEGEA